MIQVPPNASSEQSARRRYPGTRPFSDSAEDCALFFGRREEGEELYLRVLSVPLFVQFGNSGLGKTSLLQASLFPRLRQKPFLPVTVRLNVADETLTRAVARSIEQACKAEGLEFPEVRTDGLWELLSTALLRRYDRPVTPVLVFDQFEEVFTLRDAAFRAELAVELGALATGIAPKRFSSGKASVQEQFGKRPDVKIILSLREEYLGALEEFSAAIPSLFQERLRLGPLSEHGAREAITEPAQLQPEAGEEPYWSPRFELDPPVLDEMMKYLKGESDVIEPFTLQLLCQHTEAIAHDKAGANHNSVKLTADDFKGGKSFASVLRSFYLDILNKLSLAQRENAEELCEHGLLDRDGHRLMLEEAQIGREFDVDAKTLEILAQERLVRREPRLESVFYEISHDQWAKSIFMSRRDSLSKKELQRRRKLERINRVISALCLLMLLLTVAALIFYVRAKKERKHAETEAKHAVAEAARAETERQNTEQLLGFLLGESFLGEIRDIGRSTMLEKVQKRVVAAKQSSVLNKGLTLRNEGDIARTRGEIQKSVELFGKALVFIESSPDNPDKQREVARTRDRMGDALADQGEITEALTHYDAEVAAWRQLVSGASRAAADPAYATDDCVGLADSLVSAGDLKRRMGDADGALKYMQESIEIVSAALFGRKTLHVQCGPAASEIEPYPNAKALEVLSRAVNLRADVLGSPEDYDVTAALALEARRLQPFSMDLRRQALTSLAVRAIGGSALTPGDALRDYQKVLAESDELLRWDPANKLWQREQAASQLLVASGMVACVKSKSADCKPMPSLEDAEGMSLEAIETLRTLAQSDPSNVSWKSDIAWALQEHAKVLTELGQKRQRERLEAIEESERIYDDLERDSAYPERIENVASLLEDKAEALAALGDRDQAEATWQRAFERFKKLIEKHPDMPIYVFDLSDAFSREATVLRNYGDRVSANAAEKEKEKLEQKYLTNKKQRDEEAVSLFGSEKKHAIEGDKLFKEERYGEALSEFSSAEMDALEYMRLRSTTSVDYDNLRSIYARIANTYEKLGIGIVDHGEAVEHGKQRIAALRAAMYAATIAALLEPDDKDTINKLETTRRELAQLLRKNGRLGEAMIMVREEVVAAADLVSRNKLDASYLWTLGNAQCGRGLVRRENKQEGWKESIRDGLIQLQKAAEIKKQNSAYAKEVGYWRKYLADQLEGDGNKNEAMEERRLALEAYRNAAKRAPDNEEIKKAIRDLAEQTERFKH
jgi:tetratricopeptide (TPR) repeat protein